MQGSVTKIGLWGGQGGSQQDITVPPKRLQSLTIRSGNAIDSIQFTYTDKAGQKHTAGPWGGFGGTPQTVSEFVLSFGFFSLLIFFLCRVHRSSECYQTFGLLYTDSYIYLPDHACRSIFATPSTSRKFQEQ
jgi:hypothetical protein